MPMPLPMYVRSPIREIVKSQYPDGMTGLARAMNVSYTTLLHEFQHGQHHSLAAFNRLAEELRVDSDRLAAEITTGDRQERTNRFLKLAGDSSVNQTILRTGIEQSYIYSILRGEAANKIRKTYMPMAKEFGMTLSELEQALIK